MRGRLTQVRPGSRGCPAAAGRPEAARRPGRLPGGGPGGGNPAL